MTRYSWMFLIPIVAIIIIAAISFIRFRKHLLRRNKKEKIALIAHTNFIRNLPEYKAAKKHYNSMLCLLVVLFTIATSAISAVASRPINVTESKAELENRDIMLCLDVSGSMSGNLNDLLSYFIELVSNMEGERFGITIFDGIYVTLSPLSTDYTAVIDILTDIKDNFSVFSSGLYSAQGLNRYSSSEIGPGLVGCVTAFDKLGEAERSRSIILATDNQASPTQAVTLKQAAYFAKSYDITVYGLNTWDYRTQEEIDNDEGYETKYVKEFRESTLLTGGSYYAFGPKADLSAKRIVDQILAQEAARYEGAGQIVRTDTPEIAAIIAAVSMILFIVISWRLRL